MSANGANDALASPIWAPVSIGYQTSVLYFLTPGSANEKGAFCVRKDTNNLFPRQQRDYQTDKC